MIAEQEVYDSKTVKKRMEEALSAIDFAQALYQDHIVENHVLTIQKWAELSNHQEVYEKTLLIVSFMRDQKGQLNLIHNQIRLGHYLKSLRDCVVTL